MAMRHQLVARQPEAVWAVLEDPARYSDWVVGTDDSEPSRGHWPQVGSTLVYQIRLARWTLHGHTTVRRHEPPHWLELEAYFGFLGTVRIALEIRPWGEETLVIVDEHPLRGMGGHLHNAAFDALIQLRHRSMLTQLAHVVERSDGDAVPSPRLSSHRRHTPDSGSQGRYRSEGSDD